jgi:hypothetical protein
LAVFTASLTKIASRAKQGKLVFALVFRSGSSRGHAAHFGSSRDREHASVKTHDQLHNDPLAFSLQVLQVCSGEQELTQSLPASGWRSQYSSPKHIRSQISWYLCSWFR